MEGGQQSDENLLQNSDTVADSLSDVMRSIEALTMAVRAINKVTIENQKEIARLNAVAASETVSSPQPSTSASAACRQSAQAETPLTVPAAPPGHSNANANIHMLSSTRNEYIEEPRMSNVNTPLQASSAAKLYALPTFSGIPEEWPLFIASYNDSTAEFGYTNRQNLMRLHKCLVGQAREVVAAMLIYPEDVPTVIEELEFRFGRPELLVRSQLAKVKQIPFITDAKIEQIIGFSTKVRAIVAFFSSSKYEHHLANPILMEQLIGKLPISYQLEWIKYSLNIKPYPTVAHFSTWLSQLARNVSLIPATSKPFSQAPARNMHIQQSHNGVCFYCEGEHMLTACEKFKKLDAKSMWGVVKEKRLCFGCLGRGHNSRICKNKKKCQVNGCKFYHHKLLHEQGQEPATVSCATNAAHTILSCHMEKGHSSQLFKIVPVELFGPNGKLRTYAMLDEGCAITLLDEEISTQLGLKGRDEPLTLQWYGDKLSTEPSKSVNLEISKVGGRSQHHIKNVRTVKNLQLPTQSLCKEEFAHMRNIDLENFTNAKPVILIGLDNLHLGVASKIVKAGNFEPVAALTKLGWIAYGPLAYSSSQNPIILHIKQRQPDNIECLVKEYFDTENFGLNNLPTLEADDSRYAREIMERTTKRIGNKFETGLLWKPNVKLPKNYKLAEKRLYGIERKMKADVEFATKYRTEMSKYLDKNYARLLSEEEVLQDHTQIWYLPHFAVKNVHKPNKMRIVFDAAATIGDVSLNSVLFKGPEQAKPLLSILFKFRMKAVGVAADIREMFSQVKIRSEDQHAQRFLWRDGDETKPIQHYVMTSMIFGAICSPCCAEYVKNVNAYEFSNEMPRAADAIINSHYVDDFVLSFDNAAEALTICKQIIYIHSRGGFDLRNFVSNDDMLQNTLNNKNIRQSLVNMEKQAATEKILGMYWNTKEDIFQFETKFHRVPKEVMCGQRIPTKRELLSIVMSIYDPFGMLSDFHILVKILLQQTWSHKVEWDETIPLVLHKKWQKWLAELQNITQFKVPRVLSVLWQTTNQEHIQLHIIVDASEEAFAAVAYIRVSVDHKVDVTFLMGKTRLAPKKLMSIPRLELQAAVLGVRLSRVIAVNLTNIQTVIFWSDSKTVLNWIHSSTRKFKPFVGHRVAEILNVSKREQWRWIPTDENTADSATRSSKKPEINDKSKWLTGPAFLKEADHLWPKNDFAVSGAADDGETIALTVLNHKVSNCIIDFSKFSNYLKLKRVMARVVYAKRIWLRKIHKGDAAQCDGLVTVEELCEAEFIICKAVQHDAYKKEIAALSQKRALEKNSDIYRLSPILDDKGILRVGGRINEATCLPWTARFPILLPTNHYVSFLIIRHFHEKFHHQNRHVIINECRQTFWIPKIKRILSKVEKACMSCVIEHKQPKTPLMGQLPKERVTPYVRPFTYTGVDLFGPLSVKIGRRQEKRWVSIFTCLTTRATHLEICENLSADAFLICFRNFVNRRGNPVIMRSDNGTNFIAVQKELNKEDRLFDVDKMINTATNNNIKWIFNCPSNPNAGGCWERLIRIVKNLLNKTLRDLTPKVETLRSVLIEAENILNARPMTEVPLSHEDDEPLTPNHFLIGFSNSTQTPQPAEENVCLKKQWRIAQNLKDRVWKRWVCEYLPQLIHRSKWHDNIQPLKINDLVLIADHTLSRNNWKKGRIIKVHQAKDGQVRVASVKTADGVLKRPASKLIPLVVADESCENSSGGGM